MLTKDQILKSTEFSLSTGYTRGKTWSGRRKRRPRLAPPESATISVDRLPDGRLDVRIRPMNKGEKPAKLQTAKQARKKGWKR